MDSSIISHIPSTCDPGIYHKKEAELEKEQMWQEHEEEVEFGH